MVLAAQLGHNIGSDHYLNDSINISNNIGDHGIGKVVNTGNTNMLAGVPSWSCTLEDDTEREGEGRVKDDFQVSFFHKWLCNFLKQRSWIRSNLKENKISFLECELELLFYIQVVMNICV